MKTNEALMKGMCSNYILRLHAMLLRPPSWPEGRVVYCRAEECLIETVFDRNHCGVNRGTGLQASSVGVITLPFAFGKGFPPSILGNCSKCVLGALGPLSLLPSPHLRGWKYDF